MNKLLITLTILLITSDCLAYSIPVLTIAKEGSGENLEAQILIGRVIRTRMKERHLNADKVCLQNKQFSCWNKGTKQKERSIKELETAQQAWNISENRTDNINLYHDTSVKPYWVKSVKFIKQVGQLKFYKEE
jgi:spore germination cell wall hydrolase CwlJ-like protein